MFSRSGAGKVSLKKNKKSSRVHYELDELILNLKKAINQDDYESAAYYANKLPRPIPWDSVVYNWYPYVYQYKRMIENFLYANDL